MAMTTGSKWQYDDWIMEGILRRSGFRIDSAEYGQDFQTTDVCTKASLLPAE